MSVEKIFSDFVRYAEEKGLAIEGIAIADSEKVLLEHHFTPDQPRNIYSHTKSYMVTAVGSAIEEGLLDLDTPLVSLFPEKVPENADPGVYDIRLKHLLTMSSGFDESLLMGAQRRAGVGFPDYVSYMLSQPLKKKPGERFHYSTADSILAGRMVEAAAGKNLASYLYEKVFSKLGQGFPLWECCPEGHPIGGGGMSMRLTDMMKLGQVYLNQGMWKGERIVDASWVKACSTKQIETPVEEPWNMGYGYQFWISPYKNSYRADGAYGQITTILPESGLAAAIQCPESGDFYGVTRQEYHEHLLLPIAEEA